MRSDYVYTRVLVVDDDRGVADTLGLILRACGHEVHVAYNGEEAVLAAEAHPPHVLISDVMMPGMNGIDLAVWFAKHHPDCKVLLVSGHPGATMLLEQSKERGVHHTILPKPVHPTEIVEFIVASRPSPRPRVTDSIG